MLDGQEVDGPQPARRAGARRRHGLSAFHAGALADRGREPRRQPRRRAGDHQLAQGATRDSKRSSTACRSGCRSTGRFLAGGGREAEARNPQAPLSQPALPDPRRADLGADARRGRRDPRPAQGHGASRRDHGRDDQPQVPRGRGVLRRRQRAQARRQGRRRQGRRALDARNGGDDDRRRRGPPIGGARRGAAKRRQVSRSPACSSRTTRAATPSTASI